MSLCLLGIWATSIGAVCVPTSVLTLCPPAVDRWHTGMASMGRECTQEKGLAGAMGTGAELERQL